MSITLYERRLLNELEITKALSDIHWGIIEPQDITLELDNSDRLFSVKRAAGEEFRNRGIKFRIYEPLDDEIISFLAYGKITGVELDGSKIYVKVALQGYDPAFDTILPKKVYETIDWSSSPPNIINPSKDLGNPYNLCFGYCKKVPLVYVHANYDSDYYDYIIGVGTIESNNNNKASTVNVYRNKRLVGGAEYYVHGGESTIQYTDADFGMNSGATNPYHIDFYGGSVRLNFAFIRFKEMQRVPNGNLYDFTADVRGLKLGSDTTATRNYVRVIRHILSNTDWGLGLTINAASFNNAETLTEELLCDGFITGQMKIIDVLNYLLYPSRASIDWNETGEIVISVDDYNPKVYATFGHKDNKYENLIDNYKIRPTPIDNLIKTFILEYGYNSWDDNYIYQNKRADIFPFGDEKKTSNPFIRDHTTADRITSFQKNLLVYGDLQVDIILGMEARKLIQNNQIHLVIPDESIDANFQIRKIRKSLNKFSCETHAYVADIYQYIPGNKPDDETADNNPDTSFTPPDAPTGVALDSQGTYQSSDGTTLAYKIIKGTAPATNFQIMLFGYRKTTETVLPYTWYEGQLSDSPTRLWKGRIDGLVPGISYDFAVMCRNPLNNPGCTDSAFTVLTGQVALGDTTPPAKVTGVTGSAKYKTWHFQWDKNSEATVKDYHVQIGNSSFSTIYFEKYIGGNSVDFTDDARAYGTLYCRVKASKFTPNLESTLWSSTASATTNQTQTDDVVDDGITTPKRQDTNVIGLWSSYNMAPGEIFSQTYYHGLGKLPAGIPSSSYDDVAVWTVWVDNNEIRVTFYNLSSGYKHPNFAFNFW